MPTLKLSALVVCAAALAMSGCNCGSSVGTNTDGGAGGGSATGGGQGGGNGGGTAAGLGGNGGDGGSPIDPNDLDNPNKDSDCDGLTDAEEFGITYAGGKRTSPSD